MEIINHYFKLEKDLNKNTTYHITKYFSINEYETESFKPKQRNSVYLMNDVSNIKSKGERKPIKRLTSLGHITGIFIPDLKNLSYAFGDFHKTEDLIQFLFYPDIKEPATIEMFVSIGEKQNYNLFNAMYIENAFEEDFEFCRVQAIDFLVMPKVRKCKVLNLETALKQ